jgi:hypothetical protein
LGFVGGGLGGWADRTAGIETASAVARIHCLRVRMVELLLL